MCNFTFEEQMQRETMRNAVEMILEQIAALSPRQTHQDLIRKIRTQVEILVSRRCQARSSRYLRTCEGR